MTKLEKIIRHNCKYRHFEFQPENGFLTCRWTCACGWTITIPLNVIEKSVKRAFPVSYATQMFHNYGGNYRLTAFLNGILIPIEETPVKVLSCSA